MYNQHTSVCPAVDGPCLLDYLVIELDLSVVLYVTLPLTLATVD